MTSRRTPRILTVFGTRPEAIKMAPIVRALACRPSVEQITCVTAQHRELLDEVMHFFELEADIDLDLMRPGQGLQDLTARVLASMQEVIRRVEPDVVLIQGDTTTACATALAAFQARVRVAHVEAGLRSGDLAHPWPEEVNRRLIAQLASWHFAPTALARRNLLAEGVEDARIFVTGNTVIDALTWARERTPAVAADDASARMVLVTSHRRENFRNQLADVTALLQELARRFASYRFVFPVHPNPHVREPVERQLAPIANIELLPPLPYPEFVGWMQRAWVILTDSGGVQEEAPALGKPVLVMREVSDRPESIEAGAACVVGVDAARVAEALARLENPEVYRAMSHPVSPYGDGSAAQRIVEILCGV